MALAGENVDRRSRILDATVRVISERGVDGARLADVAEAAGVSLGLVQHYFRHRDRLLVEVFRREQQRISATWAAAMDPDSDPLLRLTEFMRLAAPEGSDAAVAPFDPGWSFWLEFWSKANRDERIRAEVVDIYGEFAELFRAAIRHGVASGEFRIHGDVDDAADRLISLMDGAAIRTLLGGLPRERMLPLLVDGLCTELGVSDELRRRAHRHARRDPA